MDWNGLADVFVVVMQALSLGMLCCGAVISIREAFSADSQRGPDKGVASVAPPQLDTQLSPAPVRLTGP
jgi:hypothetical protein